MSGTKTISIKGQRLSISSIISESFVYKTSDRESHAVSVDMSDNGMVTIKVDGKQQSSYLKEIIESGLVDNYISRLYSRLAGAYQKLNDYYLFPYKDNEPVLDESDIKAMIDNLTCEQYHPNTFDLVKPDIQSVECDLLEEAKMDNIEDPLEVEKYIADHVEDSYKYRLLKWESIRNFHDEIESIKGKQINDQYKVQYEKRKEELVNIIKGEDNFVDIRIKELEEILAIPFSTEIRYDYDKRSGKLSLELESTSPIKVPDKKAITLPKGDLQVVKISDEEMKLNQTISMISYMFHVAWSFMNISTNIKEISITLWKLRNQAGWCWFLFTRDEFSNIKLDINNIVDQCKKVNHVFDLSNYGIMPMRAELFEYAIKNGKYDDNILLEFTNYSKSIAEKAKTVAVDLPNLSDANSHQSINDNDYGYNLSIKPQYDKSFVSFSYKLLNYKVCSIKLFIKDFGMSMDRAKDFMYKLLYL